MFIEKSEKHQLIITFVLCLKDESNKILSMNFELINKASNFLENLERLRSLVKVLSKVYSNASGLLENLRSFEKWKQKES